MDYSLPGSSVPGDSLGKNIGSWLPCPPPGDLPDPGIELGSPALQVGSLPAELPEKPLFLTAIYLKSIQRLYTARSLSFRVSMHLDLVYSFLQHEGLKNDSCASLVLLVLTILYSASFLNSQTPIVLFTYLLDLFCFQCCVRCQVYKVEWV